MKKSDKGMKIWGLIVILMIVGSVFSGAVSAENVATDWEGYSLDEAENVTLSGNTTLINLTIGVHNITVYANDTAGNMGASDPVWFTITAPDIWVDPHSFDVTLHRGDVVEENLTIGNNGTGILIFNITTQAGAPTTTMYPLPINYGDTKIIVEQEFKKPEIRKVKKDKKEYDRVTIPGLSKIVKAGEPVLPVKSMQILLPFGRDVQSIEVKGKKHDLVGTYNVEPGEEPVPIGIPPKEPPKVLPNKIIYSSTEPYLSLYEASVQNLRGYKILNLNLYPVRYTPKPGTIAHYTEMKIIVNTKPGISNLYRGLPEDNERVIQVVDNPEIVDTYPINTKFSPSYDHVIITNSTFESAFQELADWKSRKGVRSHVVTVEYINSTYQGRDLQEKIRNYIIDSYMNDGIEYVLLGGDGDGRAVGGETGPAVVPARGFYAYAGGYTDYNIPADLYYAGLDGTWDDDNDGIWGEPGEDDLYAEVFVGRAAVDSLAEVTNFTHKTIAYESIGADPYHKNATMLGEDLHWAVWGKDYKEEIRNGTCNWGYCTVGFPPEWNVSTLYDKDGYWSKYELISIMNNGTQLIFNHLGHANVDSVMKMYNSDVDALVNDKYFFGYSQGCYDGSFDNRRTSPGSYTTYDCISEHFTLTPHGAFAFIGNSRYGWGNYYTTNGPSQHYDRQFYDAIFNESISNIGKANQDSKEDNVWQISGSCMRWCYYEINLFGDPETSLVPTAVPWLSVAPDNGTVGVGNYTNVSVCVNATYIEEGTYNASIIIANNDPDENPVTIPVNLTVIPPEHDIAVTSIEASDEVGINTTISVNGTICNLGLNDETDIVIDFLVDGVTEDNTTINLTIGNCTNVSFNWTAPGVEGEHNLMVRAEPVVGETILWNNMMSQNISVITIADIWVEPAEFNVTLHRGDIAEKNLTIGNNGTGVLEFEIRDRSGLPSMMRNSLKTNFKNAIKPVSDAGASANPDANEIYPGGVNASSPAAPLNFTDIHFVYNVEGPSGDNQCLGVEFNGTHFFVTGGNRGSDPNKVYIFDRDGNYISSFNQVYSSGWGWRDLAWDGTYLYGSDDSYVSQFLPNGTYIGDFLGPGISPCRALAYDPATDHFWTANWDSPIYEFDRSGNIINTYSNSYAIYGMAWDDACDGPWLWVFAQEGSPAVTAYQFDPINGVYTGVSFTGWGNPGDAAGGVCFTTGWDPGFGILVGLTQNVPDSIVGCEICLADAPWLTEYPTEGNVTPSNQTNITVTFNATELEEGEYNATIIIENNDPDENPVNIPVNLTVIPPEHDIAVTNLSALEEVEVNNTTFVNGTVCNLGMNNETGIVVDFTVDGGIEDNTTINLTSGNCTNVSFNWTAPGVEGEHNLTIYAEPMINETIVENNMMSQNISVRTFADIWVEPHSYNFTVQRGNVECENLTIGNNGTGILIFNITTMDGACQAPTIYPIRSRFDTSLLEYEHKPGELLVKYSTNVSVLDVEEFYKSQNLTLLKDYTEIGYHLIRVEESKLEETIEILAKSSLFETAEPNYILKAIGIPNDPRFNELWGMHNTGQTGGTDDADIDAPEAWDIFTGNKGVIVAVIDTGVDYNHEDLADNMWTNPGEIPGNGVDDDGNGFVDDYYGWDFAYNDNDPMDGHSHGTHCSGTIGGVGNNGVGVAGVSWDVRIMAVKFLNDYGSGYTSDAIAAINYSTMMGADIMSNSWGGGGYSSALEAAIQVASDAGILFVAAAGNSATNTDIYPHYPSCYDVPNVMSIAATDHNDALASFSNYGNLTVDLGAPGVNVLSSIPGNGYSSKSGTSMATPHVAGAAALIKAFNPALTHLEIKNILMNTVDPLPSLYGKTVTGGRLNIHEAMTSVSPTWLSVCPDNGTVGVGNDTNVSVCVNATYLDEGAYNGSIVIKNNDPDENPVMIPVNLTVTPPDHDIAVTNLSALEEVEVNNKTFVNGTVCNLGLNNETGIVVDFIVDSIIEDNTTINLTSGNCTNVSFNWIAPSVEGEHNLTIYAEPVINETIVWNNMMSQNISVITIADIWVYPEEFNVTLDRGDITNRTLTIGNNGTGVLEFEITDDLTAGGKVALISQDTQLESITYILDDIGIDYDVLNYDGYTGIYTSNLTTLTRYSTVIYYNHDFAITQNQHDALEAYLQKGGNLLVTGYDHLGSPSDPLLADIVRSSDYGDLTGQSSFTVTNGLHSIMNGPYGNYPNGTYFTLIQTDHDQVEADTACGAVTVASLPTGYDKIIATEIASGGKVVDWNGNSNCYDWIGDTDLANMLKNTLDWFTVDSYNWLNESPKSGTVNPSNQTNITITINATNLEIGPYNATIIIKNNDLDENPVNISVNLTVIPPDHDIAVTNLSVPEEVEVNTNITVNATVCNRGSSDETDIVVDFIVDGIIENNTTIPSLTSSNCTDVSFDWTVPGVEGEHNLIIYAELVTNETIVWNNMMSQNISVITIPDIWVYPEEFNVTLDRGDITNRTLTIGNNGTGILNASLSTSSSTDIDQDNEQEIIVRHYSGGYTYVVNNSNLDTNNGWEWRSPYTDSYKGFAIADVNGDGIPNLLEGGYNYLRAYDVKNKVTLYSNLYTGGSYGGTAAGDIDNDGITEMLVSDYNGYIYVYDGTTGMPDAQGHITTPTAYYGTGLGIGDIDNDGVVEVVRADYYGIDIFNGETRALETEIPVSYIWSYPDLVFGDANTNGIAEMYVGGYYGYVYAYEWDGTTATQLWRSFDLGSYTRPCGFANADNDGDFEVFVGASNGYIYALDASTGIVEGSVYTGYSSYTACAVGDIDGDGDLEIVTGNYDGYIRTYTYDSGTFTLEKTSVTDYGSYLGYMTDSIIISGARDPRVFNLINYIQFNESAVSVPPNSSHNVTVTFNATTLNKGTYNATIVIDNNDPDENPVLIPVNLTVITPPHIISYSPVNLTLTKYVGNISTFIVTTDQVMTSNSWFILPEGTTALGNGTSSLTVIWSGSGVYNVTYVGTNENGSVNITWLVTVLEPPTILDWYNSKTKDNSTSVGKINASEEIDFNASANQSIATWNWFKNGVNQNNNYENFSTSWSEEGEYIVSVNASNVNGTSNTVIWNVTVESIPSMEVNKTVWNPVSWTWEKSIEANVNDIVRFKCIIHNNGDSNLTNITAIDKLSEGLEYADNATHPEHWISPDNRTIEWLFEGPITPCENITIEFDAHVVKSGTNTNTHNATAWCEETGTWVYDEDSVIVSSPPPTPFMIYGWIYRNGDPVNNPNVNITNLNTTEVFTAKTNESYNYYQVLTDSEHVSTDNVLHFYASDNGNATEFNHTVTQDEMDNGGFEQNITIPLPSPEKPDLIITEKWVCWPDNCTICYNLTNIGNGTALAGHNTTLYVDGVERAHDHVPVPLASNKSYIGCFENYIWTYTPPSDNITVCADNNNAVEESNETNNCLTNIWMCGDVNEDHAIDILDVIKVYKRAGDPKFPLLEWAADVNKDKTIDILDVIKIYNRAGDLGFDLNCCCEK